MEIRKLKLPQDLDGLAEVTMASFQYPDNPEWNVQEDEVQEINDTINAIRRYWLLLRVAMVFSPAVRHLLQGYICEEDGEIIGTLMHQRRQGDGNVYYISNVAVHPGQRRRGIARKLVEAALDEARAAGASRVMLDVIAGNLPAYKLYERMGWEHFSGNVHLTMEVLPEQEAARLEGFEVVELLKSDWHTEYAFAQRVTPHSVQQYDPIVEASYREGWLMSFLESLPGVRRGKLALRGLDGKVVAVGGYRYRTRPGGSNNARVVVDPVYSQVAPFFVDYVTRYVQLRAPGRKIELVTPSWQADVAQGAKELGYSFRYEYHSMGLFTEGQK